MGEVGEDRQADLAAGDAGAARDHVAAGELVGGDVAEVEGDAGAGGGLLAGFAADVEGAGAELARLALGAGGDEQEGALAAEVEAAGEEGAGGDGAVALDHEDAVDRDDRSVAQRAWWDRGGELADRGRECWQALAGVRGAGHDREVGEAGGEGLEGGAHVGLGERDGLGVAAQAVDLGQGDDAMAQAEQLAHVQVLAGLRHHAVLGRDHEEDGVDASGAGDHRAHEGLVAGDVDDAGGDAGAELPGGEAELDGDAAAFLLGEAVGVDAGEGADEGGLAVVDVSGRAEDEGAVGPGHGGRVYQQAGIHSAAMTDTRDDVLHPRLTQLARGGG